jgi:hypothetical protein
MPRDDKDRADSLEYHPVERRQTPRGPIPGVKLEVLEGAPLSGKSFDVDDVGLDSLFILGDLAAKAAPGQVFRVAVICHGERAECAATCVRSEAAVRVGAVLLLNAEAATARGLLKTALSPSGIPVGQD